MQIKTFQSLTNICYLSSIGDDIVRISRNALVEVFLTNKDKNIIFIQVIFHFIWCFISCVKIFENWMLFPMGHAKLQKIDENDLLKFIFSCKNQGRWSYNQSLKI